MTILSDFREVKRRVARILFVYKYNKATGQMLADDLREDFIKYVSHGGCVMLEAKAKEILKIRSIFTPRYYE